jgi:hypothetical protein
MGGPAERGWSDVTALTAQQEQLCRQTKWNFSDLRALFINCTLKRSPELSHTQGLADISIEIMRSLGVTVDIVRAIDHDVATGVCLVTGNEDGVKHCAMNVLYSLQHLGYVIPPQADAGWIGAAGPGPSYLDPGSGGPNNDFTNRNTTFMTWNLLHLARMITDAGGIPVHGNQRSEWDAGCRFDFPNPEHR